MLGIRRAIITPSQLAETRRTTASSRSHWLHSGLIRPANKLTGRSAKQDQLRGLCDRLENFVSAVDCLGRLDLIYSPRLCHRRHWTLHSEPSRYDNIALCMHIAQVSSIDGTALSTLHV